MDIKFDYTLLIQFANFIILLMLLNVFLFKPLLRSINQRDDKISSSFERARNLSDESKRLEENYEDELKEKKLPVNAERDTILSEAHRVSVGMIETARSKLTAELTKIRKEVSQEGQKISEDLRRDVARLSKEAAEKVLKRSL